MAFLIVALVAAVIALATSVAMSWWDSRNDPPVVTDRDIYREATRGDRYRAIRFYRKRYGCGAKAARDAIDRIAKEGPRGN